MKLNSDGIFPRYDKIFKDVASGFETTYKIMEDVEAQEKKVELVKDKISPTLHRELLEIVQIRRGFVDTLLRFFEAKKNYYLAKILKQFFMFLGVVFLIWSIVRPEIGMVFNTSLFFATALVMADICFSKKTTLISWLEYYHECSVVRLKEYESLIEKKRG